MHILRGYRVNDLLSGFEYNCIFLFIFNLCLHILNESITVIGTLKKRLYGRLYTRTFYMQSHQYAIIDKIITNISDKHVSGCDNEETTLFLHQVSTTLEKRLITSRSGF